MSKAMIVSVGGTPEPLIKSISNYSPDLVYFMASQASITQIGEIREKANISPTRIKTKILEDPQSLVSAFKTASEVIKELKDEYEIWIDYTGGTKSMSAGLVVAGLSEGCKFVYVGAVSKEGRDKEGLGSVKDGFESILPQANPYELFAIPETVKGIDLFNRYQFVAALKNFDYAFERIQDERERERLRILRGLTDAYSLWDKFKLFNIKKKSLIHILEINLSDFRRMCRISREEEPVFIKQIEKNIEFLKLRFGNEKYIIADLLSNAKRRIEEGKYDDAVARLYRAVELIVQIKLLDYGLDDLSEAKFTIDDLKQRGIATGEYEIYGDERGKLKLGLEKKFLLLRDLEWKEADDIYLENKEMKGLLQERNSSILAHGLKPVEKKVAEGLYVKTKEYARIIVPDLEKLLDDASFPRL